MIRVEHIPAESGEGTIARVVIDRREKKNALTPDMLENIRAAADKVHEERGGVRAFVLAGEGDVFCAGFDLSLCKDDPLAMGDLLTRLSHAVRAIRRLPMPVIAAAHGAAIAGGCALLCAADFVITNREARLGYPVVRLGVSPAVNAPILAVAIGHGRARERLLDPSVFSGEEALRIGFAHTCADTVDQVNGEAMRLAHRLAAKPHHSLYMTKHWLNELDASDDPDLLEGALKASLAITNTEEERSLLSAVWKR
ncbi:MAG: enoyl-CoA hydratase/isomerase family protein [Planctomycetota bacterium]|nr:enoyl-CoA hydratase/isomerase family protein [Planctomycetota bacterium]